MPLSTPFQSPRLYNVIAVLLALYSYYLAGSFAVRSGDHLRFWDLRSYLGLICGRGSFAVSGSFAALYSSLVLIVSHTSTLDEAHSWTLVCSLVKRLLTISHTSTFHGACEISKHPSARTAALRSFHLRFSFSIVRLRFFRHAVLSRIINSQARQVNVTDNTTRSQSTFFGRGRLGGRVL